MPMLISRVLAVAAVSVVLAACNSGSNSGSPAASTTNQPPSPHPPAATTDADWTPAADALGRTGKLGDNKTAYRVTLTRNDLQVTTDNVPIKPGLSLGGYAAFARYDNNMTLLMGDLVVTEAELPR